MATNSTNNTQVVIEKGADQVFEVAIEKMGETMMEFFQIDPEGNEITLTEDETSQTVEQTKAAVSTAFGPLFDALRAKIASQGADIEHLTSQIAVLRASATGVAAPAPGAVGGVAQVPVAEKIPLPTIEWLAAHHKNAEKAGDITNYNAFAMYYRSLNEGKQAPQGVWDQQDKNAWKDLVTKYNESRKNGHSAVSSSSGIGTTVVPIAPLTIAHLPEHLRNSKARSAYQLYVAHWKTLPENKGMSFPTGKGFWAKLPAEERAPFEAQFKLLQAARAVKA
jgi:hypothetical protein